MNNDAIWSLAHGRSLDLSGRAAICGIVNVTPDSFSDGGQFDDPDRALEQALALQLDGATIIDIGGESTRPGAAQVSAEDEQQRVLPVVKALLSRSDILISVDSYRTETLNKALEEGAHIINDIKGLQGDSDVANLAARTGAGLVIMHNGRDREKHADVIRDQLVFFERSLELAAKAGVKDSQIVLDPGFGFAKDEHENLELMHRLDELHVLGRPLYVGTSRKRFLGFATNGLPANERDIATAATSVMLRERGAAIFRVHNVTATRDALAVVDAMRDTLEFDDLTSIASRKAKRKS
ncbi:dihydropteroate synthase [Limoniibacter endophyticus]|uniref:Dihydropteroate synthase n=1 Tax=Limoniibacter endophyticus TaxID=1565040 RepID=A0A8J3DFA5_9HYPH|nr:dihydropteroate synthase [Limoniibacter endophyticus]GHC60485.1 dihydropteroate synthase [Limoniibacter endophyticus]